MASLDYQMVPVQRTATWTLFQHMKAAGLCWNCAANFARSDNCRTFPVDCNQSLKQLWILSWPKLAGCALHTNTCVELGLCHQT